MKLLMHQARFTCGFKVVSPHGLRLDYRRNSRNYAIKAGGCLCRSRSNPMPGFRHRLSIPGDDSTGSHRFWHCTSRFATICIHNAFIHTTNTFSLLFVYCVCIIQYMNSANIIKLIEADGWQQVRVTGSHHHFKHPKKPGLVTIPHPKKDLPKGTVNSILKQAGLK